MTGTNFVVLSLTEKTNTFSVLAVYIYLKDVDKKLDDMVYSFTWTAHPQREYFKLPQMKLDHTLDI